MKKYLVIGNPIEHSLSPKLHNFWIRENNIDAVYDKSQSNEGDIKGKKGDVVIAFADTSPSDTVLGQEIFKVIHQKSKTEIYVSLEDLEEK